jgi:hypothetical protein
VSDTVSGLGVRCDDCSMEPSANPVPSVERVVPAPVASGRRCRVLVTCWALLGAGGCAVLFIWSTGRVLGPDEMVVTPSWMPGWLSYIIWLAGFLVVIPWVLTLGLILILGVVYLHRVAPGRHLWQVAWAGTAAAGVALIALMADMQISPTLPYTGPTIVSWGELPVSAGFLALGAVMIALLTAPARSASRRAAPRLIPPPTSPPFSS